MKTVGARQANKQFSTLLSQVEHGEEVVITKRGKPVAVLSRYRPRRLTAERKKAIEHAVALMTKGLPWGDSLPRIRREETHER